MVAEAFIFPLSFAQERLWFLQQLDKNSVAYNLPAAIRLQGRLHTSILEQSLQTIVQRHEILRTTFVPIDGRTMQVIVPTLTLSLTVTDLQQVPNPTTELQRLTRAEAQSPFDLATGPLIRTSLLRLHETEHVLLVTLHHIIADGWSIGILIREWMAGYTALVADQPVTLPDLPIQYADFATWQRDWLQGETLAAQMNFWKNQLADIPPVLTLPTDRLRPPIQTAKGDRLYFTIYPDVTQSLRTLSQNHGVTLFMTLLAAFSTLLYRYSGQDDIVIGSPVANRNRQEIEPLIGFFVNTLVLRTDLSENPRFSDLLKRVQQTTLAALAHQDMPFEKLVETIQPERDMSHSPLFQVMFAMQNTPTTQLNLPDLSVEFLELDNFTAKFDLTLFVEEQGAELKAELEYNTDLFDASTITRFISHLQNLLAGIVANPKQRVAQLPLLSDAEKRQLLIEWNDTNAPFPQNTCLSQLFEQQVARTPQAIAVEWADQQLTYAELNSRANQLAHDLRSLGVKPEVLVGICAKRSPDMLVGLLAILKAGGAYVPLDPTYPQERLAFMLADAQVPVLLTQRHLLTSLPQTLATTVFLEDKWSENPQNFENLENLTTSDNLAYVIYTSGSTGQPKGTMLTHRGLVNYLWWAATAYRVAEGVGAPVSSSLSFDATITSLYTPLLVGKRVILLPEEQEIDALSQILRARRDLSLIKITPAHLELLNRILPATALAGQVNFVILGGEGLFGKTIAYWQNHAPKTDIVNEYGPTETVVGCCVYVAKTPYASAVPVGRPIANTQLFILDKYLQPVPIGVPGELLIGGAGVARGYLNRPELTAEKFIHVDFAGNFSSESKEISATNTPLLNGMRLYKTGDLARYLPDGNIEYLGRLDHQVKIRGFRIELGEIEAILSQHPSIRETAVIVHENTPDDKRLIAYVVAKLEKIADTDTFSGELRLFLKKKLPDYMVPATFTFLESLPLTPNGKVDRAALPRPDLKRTTVTYLPPSNEIEQTITTIWQDVLHVDKVGIHDNFFDLGGHSLLLIQVQAKLREMCKNDVTIVDLFKYPTISALAHYLNRMEPLTTPPKRVVKPQEPIAIIGMACRFPGAKNVETFWQNLRNGVESITFFTDEELQDAGVNPEWLKNPNYVKASPVLENIELFDAAFFGFSPKEAEFTDPQHRLFLECAWESFEQAGYNTTTYTGRIGVFTGVGINSYLMRNLLTHPDIDKNSGGFHIALGNDKDFVPMRVSYHLDLRGPSVNVNTACSSSLVALQIACQNLLNNQCDMALAGGVTIQVPQIEGYWYQEGLIFSPDGHCRSFDARAQGMISGSGVGVVVLKRLADALADGDIIHAVVKSAAINNDGAFKVGFTAPSVEGQATAIADAQALAGISPEEITYIEAHGTATPLGDPIEISALTQVFRYTSQKIHFCALGSVKSNFGHLDTAAGIAGLIKTVLALKNQEIPPSLHFHQPNSQIDFANSPFYVNTQLTEWKTNGSPRRAGVSSFGIGGTNAHVILEEAPSLNQEARPSRPWQLLLLSARTATALNTAEINLAEYLEKSADLNLADAAYTLQVGRKAFDRRCLLVCQNRQEAIAILRNRDQQRLLANTQEPGVRTVAFLFSGQGAQYVNMAKGLYQNEPVFREHVDNCAEWLKPLLGMDLRTVLYPSEIVTVDSHCCENASSVETKIGKETIEKQPLDQTAFTQPALFVIEYALARLWMSWGIHPHAMLGHSIGEYVAACLAGVFTLEEALTLVVARGRLMQTVPAGDMLAVSLPESQVRSLLHDDLALAAVNGTILSVLSGTSVAIETVEKQLIARKVSCRRLHVSHAFHSQMMEDILPAFIAQVKHIRLQPPKIPYLSNVTGTWITAQEATDPEYWARHLRQTVRFADGLQHLLQEPSRLLLEVGPGRTLATLATRHPAASDKQKSTPLVLTSVRHPHEQQADEAFLLTTLGKLWLAGVTVDWQGFYARERRQRVPLPTYPFERQRYWVEPHKSITKIPDFSKKSNRQDWFYLPSWRRATLWTRHLVNGHLIPKKNARYWLILLDKLGLGTQLAAQLRTAGYTVATVTQGAAFAQLADCDYVIDPRRSQDYETLLNAFYARHPHGPTTFVHCWNVTTPVSETVEMTEVFDSSFYSLLFLAQALWKQSATEEFRIDVISNHLQEVTGHETLCPHKATLLGPVKVISQEYPNVNCRSIDVVLPVTLDAGITRILKQLLMELTSQSPDAVIAYRGNHRWVQTFTPLPLEKALNGSWGLRQNGVYLITGGLGGIGLLLADYLAKTVQAKLVLVGRTPLPEKSQWAQWLDGSTTTQLDIDWPVLTTVLTATEARLTEQLGVQSIARYPGLETTLDELCASYIYDYFVANGVDMTSGQRHTKVVLREHLRILPKFAKFFDFFLKVLMQAGILKISGDTLECLTVTIRKSSEIRQFALQQYPGFAAMFNYLDHCVTHYAAALRGDMEAVQVLFPEGQGEFLREIAKSSAEHSNEILYSMLLRDMLIHLCGQIRSRPLRILEIGAGNGFLTQALVPTLAKHNVEYYVTDIGKSFVINAERWAHTQGFSHFMRFGVLDIGRDPVTQGFSAGSFDVIIALNVVHIPQRIANTVQQLKKLLVSQGILAFIETVKQQRWVDMVWGLAAEWWQFADEELRQDSPLLDIPQWETVLAQQGFNTVHIYPQTALQRQETDCALLLAVNDEQPSPVLDSVKVETREATVIRQLLALETAGADVLVLNADVADMAQMQAVKQQVKAHFGEIHGIIHAAGIAGGGTIQLKAAEIADSEFAPKIRGALVLDALFKETPLDFMLFCSSLNAIIGGIGQVGYAAANAFLDAFAHYRATQSDTPTISINWERWRNVGLARVVESAHQMKMGEELQGGITPQEGIDAFARILAWQHLPQIIVSTLDFEYLVKEARVFKLTRDFQTATAITHPRPHLHTAYAAPNTEFEQTVADIWQEVLGIQHIGIHDDFSELGGDSLIAIRVISRLRETFHLELTVRTLFEKPTIAQIAGYIEKMRLTVQKLQELPSEGERMEGEI